MIYMIDSEGASLPTENDGGYRCFAIDIHAHPTVESGKPYLSLSVPNFFVTYDWQFYESAGILSADLAEVLNEVITDTEQGTIGKEGAKAILNALTDCADKLKLLIID